MSTGFPSCSVFFRVGKISQKSDSFLNTSKPSVLAAGESHECAGVWALAVRFQFARSESFRRIGFPSCVLAQWHSICSGDRGGTTDLIEGGF